MSKVEDMDPYGLGFLFGVYALLVLAKGKFGFFSCNQKVVELFNITKADCCFRVFENERIALLNLT